MENSFCLGDGLLVVKSKEEVMGNPLLDHTSVVLEDEDAILDSSSKLKSIEVETLLDDHFGESDVLSKQIVVEKIDVFTGEGQFGDFIVNHSLNEQEFQSENGNITIISDVFCNSGETEIISKPEEEIEIIQQNYFQENHLDVTDEISLESMSEMDEENYHRPVGIQIKKESAEVADNLVEFEVSSNSPSTKISRTQPSSSYGSLYHRPKTSKITREKRKIQIDKDDPRCRLHFVKFMKKDGKTIKIWECGLCGKEFIHQYTLMRHLPTHTDERNYKCKHCGKAFRQMSTLAQHKAIHSEFRPYVCDICQKTFSRVSTLISHKKIHTEVKTHICQICGKGFHQKGNLKNHFFTHTNERPYKCDICGRGFNQSSNLQCHKLKTHLQKGSTPQINKYNCSHCSESFSRRAQLTQHEEYIHNIKKAFTGKSSSRLSLVPSSTVLKKKKMGNIRIIQMNPGEMVNKDKLADQDYKSNHSHKSGILIDPIDTKAMHRTLSEGLTPFALLKPIKSSPVVVKVKLCDGSKHMLVSASAAELKQAGKFSITSQLNGSKIVHIKVPVVATVHQRVDENGEVHMDVEPPSDEESDNVSEDKAIDHNYQPEQEEPSSPAAADSQSNNTRNSTIIQHFIINPYVAKPIKETGIMNEDSGEETLTALPLDISLAEGIEYMIPSQVGTHLIEIAPSQEDLIATAVNLNSETSKEVDVDSTVQYIRPTENLGEYEVICAEDGTFFANSQGIIQQLKPLLDDNETVTMDQSHLTALMNVLQTTDYELQTDDDSPAHQIILNSVNDAIIVDKQVHMVISDDQDLSSVDVGELSVAGVNSESLSFTVQEN